MSFSRRRFLGGLCAASLAAGCGFAPAYGPNGAARTLRGSIEVAEPDNRDGYHFVTQLEERLGQPQAARYALAYTLDTEVDGVGISPSQATTRYNLLGRADYTVTDKASGRVVHQGHVENFTGYSATGSITGTLSARQDARSRLMVVLADQIVTRLISTAPTWQS